MTKVSILMPVYNEEKYILEAVNSILNQTFKDFELIIVDDGSIDRTWEILKSIKSNRVKIFNFGRIGKNAAINKAFEVAKGEWIIFFAGDDIMPKGSLKARYDGVKDYNFNDKVVGYSQLKIISENKKFDGMHLPKNKSKGMSSGGTTIFSRGYAKLIFPIPNDYPNEDIWTGLHFRFFKGISVHIPVIAVIYRIHSGNSHVRTTDYEVVNQNMHDRYLIYEEFLNKYIHELNKSSISELECMIKGEEYRYRGKTFRTLFIKNMSIKSRLKLFFYSNKFLYLIKYNLSRFFTGW